MLKKNFSNIYFNDKILIILLFLFSTLVNQYYGSKGVFPIDSFFHFDPGFRILNGEHPVKDYWVVHGILVDYLQALFFYIFGVSWKSYVFHASFFNGAITIATYFVLRNFDLSKSYSFVYSIFFSLLAYTSSGTPFLDHHSAFFSLLGVYCLILGIYKEKALYWALLPAFLIFAFLSKQVPSSYIILSVSFLILIYSLINKNFRYIKYIFVSFLFLILLLIGLGKLSGINLNSFLVQYIFFPPSIGLKRFIDYELTLNGIVGHYKFIYLGMIPMFYVNIKKIISSKQYIYQKEFYYFLTLIIISFSFIFHQILTKNQIFIFFLIPILFAFSQIYLNKLKLKNKNIFFILMVLICLFITSKYHLRFNENRKFHELRNVNFESSIDASAIDKKLSGLNWISPSNSNPQEEIDLAKFSKNILLNEKRNKMVITDFQFFSAILNEKLHSPSRSYDKISYPNKSNKYFEKYKNFLVNNIEDNKIEVIYFINFDAADEKLILYDFMENKCLSREIIIKQVKRFIIKKC